MDNRTFSRLHRPFEALSEPGVAAELDVCADERG
jgi:hypothetical protein